MSTLVDHRSGSGDHGVTDTASDGELDESVAGTDDEVDESADGPEYVVDDSSDSSDSRDDNVDDVVAESAGEPADVVQDGPVPLPVALRVDFGAHLEANYQRLVAQLYAITLDSGEAHEAVQDAYSRAWRSWAEISRSPDPTAWIRRVAVRSTIRSWRRVLNRFGIARPAPVTEGADARTAALLAALGRLTPAERRAVVLFHMVGASRSEIAALEQVLPGTVRGRLSRARQVVTEGMADVLEEVLGLPVEQPYDGSPYIDEGGRR